MIIHFDFILWPMLIPMFLPLIYALMYKLDSLIEIGVITLSMLLIVISYWPLTLRFNSTSNIVTKFLLFILLPLFLLYIAFNVQNKLKNEKRVISFERFGIRRDGLKNSLLLGLLLIPLMLLFTYAAKYMIGGFYEANFSVGIVSFVESFTEEFFFRGVLFLFLISRTDLKIAYTTSLASFVLMHPQNFSNLFIISTILQGFLTLEICRRSKNIVGAWILHGTNRFFSIAIFPFLL